MHSHILAPRLALAWHIHSYTHIQGISVRSCEFKVHTHTHIWGWRVILNPNAHQKLLKTSKIWINIIFVICHHILLSHFYYFWCTHLSPLCPSFHGFVTSLSLFILSCIFCIYRPSLLSNPPFLPPSRLSIFHPLHSVSLVQQRCH